MTERSRWRQGLSLAVVAILAGCSLAWVFPREVTANLGPRALPAIALSSLLLGLGLAAKWRLLNGFLVVLAITLFLGWNSASITSTSHFTGACIGFLTMSVIGRVVVTPRRMRLAVQMFLVGGILMLLLGLAGTSDRTRDGLYSMLHVKSPTMQLGLAGMEPSGEVNANALAAAALLVAPLGVSVILFHVGERSAWLGLLPSAFVAVVAAAVMLAICHSRSAWISIWLTLVASLVRGLRPLVARIIIGTIVVAPVFLATRSVLIMGEEPFVLRARDFSSSLQTRAALIANGLEHWKTSPWLGVGLNEFRSMHAPREAEVVHVHNMFLQTALDVGLVGSIAYWGMLVLLLFRANQAVKGLSRIGRTAAVGAGLSLVLVTLFGLADAVTLGSRIGIFQWMASGLILSAWQTRSIVDS